jgi:hypothetical protein
MLRFMIVLDLSMMMAMPARACFPPAAFVFHLVLNDDPHGCYGVAQYRACSSVQRDLAGAAELYYGDHPRERESFQNSHPKPYCIPLDRRFLATLKDQGYLKELPHDENLPEGLESRYALCSWANGVFCLGHGTMCDRTWKSAREQLQDAGIKAPRVLSKACSDVSPYRYHSPRTEGEDFIRLALVCFLYAIPTVWYLMKGTQRAKDRIKWSVCGIAISLGASVCTFGLALPLAWLRWMYDTYLLPCALTSLLLRGMWAAFVRA